VSTIKSQFKNSDESIKEADANFKAGKFAEAEPLYLLALVLLERQYPEEHTEVLSVMEKLGDTFYASEKWKDAAPVYRRLVGIREKVNGPTQQTVSALFKLSKTYERLNQIDEAETNYKRAVKLGEDTQGHLFANLLDAYAAMLRRNSRNLEEASQLEERAKKRREQVIANQAAAKAAQEAAAQAAAEAAAQEEVAPEVEEPVAAAQAEPAQAEHHAAAAAAHEESTEQDDGVGYTKEQLAALDAVDHVEEEKPYSPGDLDSIKAPSESAGFDKSALEAIKGPEDKKNGSSEPTGKGFNLSDLDAIKAPGEGKGSSPTRSLLGRSSTKTEAEPARSDNVSSAPAAESGTPGKNYNLTDLESIKTPSVPPPDLAAVQGKTGSHAPLPPQPPPPPVVTTTGENEVDYAENRKALSATRTGLARVQATESPASKKRTVLVVLVVLLLGGWIAYLAKTLFAQGIATSPAQQQQQSSAFAGKTYSTADHNQQLQLNEGNGGDLKAYDKHYNVIYQVWTGSVSDEIAAMRGDFDSFNKWLQTCDEGLRTQDGSTFYASDTVDSQILDQMWEMATAAQRYYEAVGRYPAHGLLDPPRLRQLDPKLTYENVITHARAVPLIIQLPWPMGENPGRPQDKTELEKTFDKGTLWNPQLQNLPGEIDCAQLGWPKVPFADDWNKHGGSTMDTFLIRGCDHNGKPFQALGGNAFIISLKKGQNCTPETAPSIAPPTSTETLKIIIGSGAQFNKFAIMAKYIGMLLVTVLLIIGIWKRGQIQHWLENLK
jgi:hypothetical protein